MPDEATDQQDERPIRLMIPGPVPLSPACLEALSQPVESHYGPEWAAVHHETVALLRKALGTASAQVYPLVGAGSTGLDAAIGSLLEEGDGVAVGVNGFFGQRMASIARGHGVRVSEVEAAWGSPITAQALEAALTGAPDVKAVLVTHVETSTGVVNPIAELAATAQAHGALILLDAVSSAGGMDIGMDELGIDVCVTASQKCLGGAAGLAPVAVNERAWKTIERNRSRRGWYLDLRTWHEYATRDAAWHPAPVTMPTNVMRALRQGLLELMAEGIPARAVRHRHLAERLRNGVREIGLRPLVDDRWAAPVVTAVYSPQGIPSGDVVRFVERNNRIRIAGGSFGPLADSVFRVGHMASGSTEQDMDDVIAALRQFLDSTSR